MKSLLLESLLTASLNMNLNQLCVDKHGVDKHGDVDKHWTHDASGMIALAHVIGKHQ